MALAGTCGHRRTRTRDVGGSGTRGISALAFSEERQLIVFAIGRRLSVYNPILEEKVVTLTDHTDTIEGICATLPSLLVSADNAGHVCVYDATCYEKLQTLSLCDLATLPLGVSPTLHHVISAVESQAVLCAAAGSLT